MLKSDIFTNDELVEINTVKEKIEQFIRSMKLPVSLITPMRKSIVTGGASASCPPGASC